ncbi:MAG: right-handed parallel beta-helix repeat-containing protein [Solirubrobacterales bacterium]|nr:right-handed parallel beta-helix repeat-containing protein [Solirubrobacterales bacterium]
MLALVGAAIAVGLLTGGGQHAPPPPRVLYVDRTSVGGPCSDARPASHVSAATPWCSLSRAFAAAQGGTVLIRGGSYPAVTVGRFAPRAPVTVRAAPGERVTIAGLSIGSPGAPSGRFTLERLRITGSELSLTDAAHVRIVGDELAVTPRRATGCTGGPPATAHCTQRTPTAITLRPPMRDLTIAHDDVHDGSVGVGFSLGQPPSSAGTATPDTYRDVAIDDNRFTRMGDVVISAQNFDGVRIAGNTFADDENRSDIDPECHCDAIHAIGGGAGLSISGNLVYGGRGFLLQPGYPSGANCAPACLTMRRVTIANNVLVGDDFGIRVQSSPGVRVVNNTIDGPGGPNLGLSFLSGGPTTTGAVVANNLISWLQAARGVGFALEDFNDVLQRGTGPGVAVLPRGAHDISAPPRYVARARHDYALASGSPGWRAGSATLAPPPTAGTRRRRQPDMGALGAQLGPPPWGTKSE